MTPITALVNLVLMPFVWLDYWIMKLFGGPVQIDSNNKGHVVTKMRVICWVTVVSTVALFLVYALLFRPIGSPVPHVHPPTNPSHIPAAIDKEAIIHLFEQLIAKAGYTEKLEKLELLTAQGVTGAKESLEALSKQMASDASSAKTELMSTFREEIDRVKKTDIVRLEDMLAELEQKLKQDSTSKPSDLKDQFDQYVKDLAQVKDRLSKDLVDTTQREKDSIVTTMRDSLTTYLSTAEQSIAKVGQDRLLIIVSEFENKARDHIQSQIHQLSNVQTQEKERLESNPSINSIAGTLSELDVVKHMIEESLEVYSADKIAQRDFALASAGGMIHRRLSHYPISKTFPEHHVNPLYMATYWMQSFTSPKPHPPETILEAIHELGRCWAIAGGNGSVGVKLASPIRVTGVSVEHPNSKISYHIESAIKDFAVIGLKNQTDSGTELGRFSYDVNRNRHLQTFNFDNKEEYPIVVLQVLSNNGYEYTCIYRFRVHGIPSSQVDDPQIYV
eukprot:gene8947-10493_t